MLEEPVNIDQLNPKKSPRNNVNQESVMIKAAPNTPCG